MKINCINSISAIVLLFVFLSQHTCGAANLLQTFDDPTVTSSDDFGRSVSVDGDHVLVGVPYDDTNGTDVGQAQLFQIFRQKI